MIPDFEFMQPSTLVQAVNLLAEFRGSSTIIAGGTDIIPGLQQGAARFQSIKILIDIARLEELKMIAKCDQTITIGAGVTFSELAHHPLIVKNLPLLAKAASTIGSVQIRNRATIGGNFINNAPCADSVPPLLVYQAKIISISKQGEREFRLDQLLSKPYQTKLLPDELVTHIILPIPSQEYRGDFDKLGRRRGVAISRITIALLLKIKQSLIEDLRIASGAVSPIGMRFPDIERFGVGKRIDDELLKILAQQFGEQIFERTGMRWSSDYKLPVAQQMFYQMISKISGN